MEDPFAGILGRSSVAQALREARASLARPTRPVTPLDRSLFRQASGSSCSRPSSSYSIGQLRLEKDMFSGSSESTISTRSTLASRSSELNATGSEVCTVIPEELEEPDLQLADVGVFGDSGEFVAEYHPSSSTSSCGKRPVIHCKEAAWHGEANAGAYETSNDDYDGGAADDLALRMDVPPPCSDEESEEDEVLRPVATSDSKPRAPGQPKGTVRPARKGKSSRGAEKNEAKDASSSSKEWQSAFDKRIADLAAKSLEEATNDIESLAGELKASIDSQQVQAVPRVLRGTLRLMDRNEADAPCLLRLAQIALNLLGLLVAAGEDAGSDGVQASYLNISKALFKLSKEAGNDSLFKSTGLLDSLMELLAAFGSKCKSSDLRIFIIGILKNVTNNDDNLKYITKRGIIAILQELMKPEHQSGNPREAQQLVQITALLRNLAASSKRSQQLVEQGVLSDLTRISAQYRSDQELQTNIARVLAKLSIHDACCEAFEADSSHVQEVMQCLTEHADSSSVVLRLTFFLGNLTTKSERLRDMFWFQSGGAAVLPDLMQKYWQKDRKLAQAEVGLARGTDAQECEEVLVKLVRLAANAAISPSVGVQLASTAAVIDLLLDVLGCKKMAESEELVLNAMAATTNLLFYGESTNLLFSADHKELLCRLLRPLLLESYNVEALIEAARAIGNLSRHQDARQWISELRIDEILAILMSHNDRDLVFYACGALVNIAADAEQGRRLCTQVGLRSKLAGVLQDAPADDVELQLVAVKVMSNLRLNEGSEVEWADGELDLVHASLARVRSELSSQTQEEAQEAIASSLNELVTKLYESLPPCAESNVQDCEGGASSKFTGYNAEVQPPQANTDMASPVCVTVG